MKIRSVKTLILAVALLCSGLSFGQMKKNIEYSGFFDTYYFRGPLTFHGGAGVPMYFGDLCSKLGCQKLGPAINIGGSYRTWPRTSLGFSAGYVKLGSEDADTDRGITFSSNVIESYAFGKIYFIEKTVRRHSDMHKADKPLKPYFKAGFGGTMNWAKISGADAEATFPKFSMIVPMGLGADYKINPRISVGGELLYRWTTNDLLDGVSAINGNDGKSDAYMSLEFYVHYSPFAKMKKKKKPVKKEEGAGGSGGDGSGGDDSGDYLDDGFDGGGDDSGSDDSSIDSGDDSGFEETPVEEISGEDDDSGFEESTDDSEIEEYDLPEESEDDGYEDEGYEDEGDDEEDSGDSGDWDGGW